MNKLNVNCLVCGYPMRYTDGDGEPMYDCTECPSNMSVVKATALAAMQQRLAELEAERDAWQSLDGINWHERAIKAERKALEADMALSLREADLEEANQAIIALGENPGEAGLWALMKKQRDNAYAKIAAMQPVIERNKERRAEAIRRAKAVEESVERTQQAMIAGDEHIVEMYRLDPRREPTGNTHYMAFANLRRLAADVSLWLELEERSGTIPNCTTPQPCGSCEKCKGANDAA